MKTDNKIIDSFQIVGFVISTAVSIILIVFKQEEILSVILGLVLAVLTQLFDLQFRQADIEKKLIRSNVLNEKLYQDKWLLEKIESIVNDYYVTINGEFNLFKLYAENRISECHHSLHSLAEGEMTVPHRSLYNFAFEGIKSAKKSIKGVNTDNFDWWRGARGQKLLQENINIIKKGVRFSRIFLIPRENLKEVLDVVQQHHQVGIESYLIFTNEIPKEYNEGFTIMDDKLVVYREKVRDGVSRERAISTKPAQVEQMIQRHQILMQYAIPIDDKNLHNINELLSQKASSEANKQIVK